MKKAVFERLAAEALDGLPEQLRVHMENVDVVIHEWPNDVDLADAGMDKDERGDLLGLYTGVPLTERNTGYAGYLPDRITLFQGPIQRSGRQRPRSHTRRSAGYSGARVGPLFRDLGRAYRGVGVVGARHRRARRAGLARCPEDATDQRARRRQRSSTILRSPGRRRRANWPISRTSASSSTSTSRVSCSGERKGSSSSRAAW